jgi:hypothetical protein
MLAWQDAYMRLDIDHERRIVRQTRSARGYEDEPIFLGSLRALVEHMRDIDRAQYGLLQDTRSPRGRNDPSFEGTIMRERPKLSGGFRKVAVLVETQVGRLQAQRFLQPTQQARVFLDEADALRWLSEP